VEAPREVGDAAEGADVVVVVGVEETLKMSNSLIITKRWTLGCVEGDHDGRPTVGPNLATV
jgi:hypothetical protein